MNIITSLIKRKSDSNKKLLGYATYGNTNEIAKQAIVFMACGINENFQLPIAYHFIGSIDAKGKGEMLMKVIDAIHDIGAKVPSVTFDGHATNAAMCHLLGANLDVDSENFKPHFTANNGEKVNIWYDPCHMIKLVRNAIGKQEIFHDSPNGNIEWKFFEQLVEIDRNKNFNMTHKLNQNHIQWNRRIMKVDLAVQTLSESTADSMEFLMNNGEHFANAGATIRFVCFFNNLFDISNSKTEDDSNKFKRALTMQNKEGIETFFT